MEIVALLFFGVVFLLYAGKRFSSNDGADFWEVVSAHPEAAYTFFLNNPTIWFMREKPSGIDVTGPFFFHHTNGETISLYCRADRIDSSQKEFLRLFAEAVAR